MVHVTTHAIERFLERVAAVTWEEAEIALSSPVVVLAAKFGARFVRLPTGQRIVIEQGKVVTVLPTDNYRSQVARVGKGRYGKNNRIVRSNV